MADTVLGDSSSSSVVLVGGSVTGTIDFTGDQDWYQVSLIAGHQYRFDLQGAASGHGTLADSYMRLLNSSGVEITYNDDSGGTLESSITYTASSSDTYFLSAQGYSTNIGTFTLVASDITGGAAGDVPGNTSSSSTLAVGGSVTGTIDASADQDWYQVALVAGHQYRFDLQGSASGQGTLADSVLRLLDGSGIELAYNDDAGGTRESSITYTAASSGTYFLSAQGFSTNVGTFALTATDLTSGGGGDVPANTGTSGAVAVGASVTGTIDSGGDEDWYRVSLESGHAYQFDLQGSTSGQGTLADPILRLLNPSGAEIAYNDDSNGTFESSITYTPAAAGTYFVSAQGFSSNTGTFTLRATDLGGGAVDVPGNTSTASSVSIGASVAGTIDTSGDQDWYQVTLTARHQYRFDLQGAATNHGSLIDPYLVLRDSSGGQIAFDDDSGGGLESSIAYTATQDGTYFLSAQAFGSDTGGFTLSAAETTGGAGDVPASTGTGSLLSMGSSVTGTIAPGGDQDWYQVALVAGHQYRFDLQGSPSGQGTLADPYLRLLDSSGVQVAFDDDSGTGLESSIAYTATSTGTYLLSAQGFSTNTGTFTLVASDITGGAAGDVPGNTSSSNSLAVGASVSGTIDASADQDWYRVDLVAGHQYRFDLQGFDSAQGTLSDPYLRLLDSLGAQITFDDDSGTGLESSITYTATQNATYFLSAEGYAGYSTGTFTLSAIDTYVDVFEGTGTRSAVTPGGPVVTSSIDASGDQDWYRVALIAGHRYAFDLQGAASSHGSLTDPLLRLLDSSGAEIAFDDDSGTGLDSNLVLTASESGTYFLSAQDYSAGAGTYALSAFDFNDPGDVLGTTNTFSSISIGGPVTGTIDTGGDQDWYQVALVAGHRYRFDLQGAASNHGSLADPFLRLLDGTGTEFVVNDNAFGTSDSVISVGALNSLTMFVSAQGAGSSTGTFTLTTTDLTAVAGDVPASTGTTAAVSVGGWVTGLVNGNTGTPDQDYYRVSLTAGRTYQFDLQGSPSGQGTLADPYLWLLNNLGAEITHNDDINFPSNVESRITYTVPTGGSGNYFLSAGGFSTNVGSFRLSATDTGVLPDVPQTPSTTSVVYPGGPLTGTIGASGDRDWYQVSLDAGHQYEFALQGAGSSLGTLGDPYLSLLDAAGTTVLASDDDSGPGFDADFLFAATQSGTYFLEARAFGSGTGTFLLGSADLTLGAVEVLGDATTNSVVGVNGSVAGTIDTGGDQDWYQVRLEAGLGQTYHFDLRGVDSGQGTLVDPVLRLLNGAGTTVLATDDDSGVGLDSSITYSPDTAGIYFLSAQAYGLSTGTFVLRVIEGADVVPQNPGTDGAVVVGGSVSGTIDTGSDQDWYRAELLAGHQYQFDLRGSASGHGTLVDPYLRLLDGAGTTVLAIDNDSGVGSDSSITYSPSQSGAYFLSAESYFSFYTGTFTLNVVDQGSLDVPANTSTGSILSSIGGTVTGTIDASGDQDWYQVSLTASHDYRFDLQGAPSSHGTLADPVLRLLGGSGNQLAFNDDSNGRESSITYSATSSGTYFLSAQGYSTNVGTFTLSSTDLSGGDIPGSTSTGAVVAVGGSVTGSLETTGDQDWYRVALVDGHQYRFNLQGSTSGLGTLTDSVLRLLDGSGTTELAYNDDSGGTLESSITYTSGTTGTYFLSAQAYAGLYTGTFTLSVTELSAGGAIPSGDNNPNVIFGSEFNDILNGLGGNDLLEGKGGDDSLDGGSGNDSLSGGLGNDVVLGGDGNDLFLQSTLESMGNDTLNGGAGDDTFNDWFGHNVLDGGAGADHFTVYIADTDGTDLVTGGAGLDTYELLPRTLAVSALSYVVTDFEVGFGGDLIDVDALLDASARDRYFAEGSSSASDFLRLSQSGPDTLVQWDRDGVSRGGYTWTTLLTLKNVDATKVNSYNFVGALDIGTKDPDNMAGTQGNDTIVGAGGNDTLNGGLGVDSMRGGTGNDIYYVDDTKDGVIETSNDSSALAALVASGLEGITDTVVAAINFSLANVAYVENLTLSGSSTTGTGNELDNVLTGNDLSNTLTGLAGNDTIDGGTNTDTAVYSGLRSQYQVTLQLDGSLLVADQRSNAPDGTDTDSNVELFQFTDRTYGLVELTNRAPVANAESYSTNEDTTLMVAASGVLGNDTDVDGNSLTAVLASNPSHGTLTLNANGSFSYTPNANYNGSDSFTYRANDGTVDSATTATVSITVNAVNDAPTGGVSITGTATEGQVLTANTATLADADGLGPLNYQWLRAGSPINGATGTTYTMTQSDVGNAISVRVNYTDGGGTAESVESVSSVGKTANLLVYDWKVHTLLVGVSIVDGSHNGITDASGSTSFTGITDTSLALTASRSIPGAEATLTSQSVNLQDAIAILKMIVGLDVNGAGHALSPYQSLAADYNGNGTVGLTDAIDVLKHVVGLPAPDPAWRFVNEIDATIPGKVGLNPGTLPTTISADMSGATPVHVGLVGLLNGDVDGSFAGAPGSQDLDVLQPSYFDNLTSSHGLQLSQFGVYA